MHRDRCPPSIDRSEHVFHADLPKDRSISRSTARHAGRSTFKLPFAKYFITIREIFDGFSRFFFFVSGALTRLEIYFFRFQCDVLFKSIDSFIIVSFACYKLFLVSYCGRIFQIFGIFSLIFRIFHSGINSNLLLIFEI